MNLNYSVWMLLVTLTGASVGSFLNVVVYRLPLGKALLRPKGSHCPTCGHKLAVLDNLPVISWLFLRARCRYCRTPISAIYPTVELLCALLFAGLFWCYYESVAYVGAPGGVAGLRPEMLVLSPAVTWPILMVHLVLLACLLAATIIDARHYIIPIGITWFAAGFALVGLPAGAWYYQTDWVESLERGASLTPLLSPDMMGPLLGAVAGLMIAQTLLLLKVLPRGFAELDEPTDSDEPQGPDQWLAYPHARREALKECLYLALPIIGAYAGYRWPIGPELFGIEAFPYPVLVAGGVVAGYLVGGLIVWLTRIFGTLGFGKEAMGLGDVHLLAAVGAVLGARDAVVIFFLAPFAGLLFLLPLMLISKLLKWSVRVIPYGPFLAVAAIVWMVAREPLKNIFDML